MKGILKKIIVTILTWEAKVALRTYDPKIIAVTGSVGKTSTKDAVFTVITHGKYARKSEKSYNSELGVPLAILGLPTAWSSPLAWLENILEGFAIAVFPHKYPEWLVLEVGADRPGDIRNLAWLKPHVVVFTHFPDVPVHVEFFESPEQVIAEKRELLKALRANGTLVVNADDPKMQNEALGEGQHLISYGMSEGATVRANEVHVAYREGVPCGMGAVVHFQDRTHSLLVEGVLGEHQLYPLLAALGVVVAEGLAFEDAAHALEAHMPPPGRMRILHGRKNSCVIDDTYNASPSAVLAGLEALTLLHCPGKKVVVLGDMMELGEFSTAEHRKVGERVAQMADVFVAVGVRMQAAAEAARALEPRRVARIETVNSAVEARALVADLVDEHDLVYVKGSQSMRMERVVEGILREPASAPSCLVRQDEEWKAR